MTKQNEPPRVPTEPTLGGASTTESSYLGQLVDGRYKIRRLIGRGGMGTVYEVEQIHLQKIMAMKLLHEDMMIRKQLISRFTREARAVSRLANAHTVRVFDFGRSDAIFYLVMEYLDGEDLEVHLSRDGALPWRRAMRILDQVCQSLEEAHSVGIVHRDLKPENIMILRHPPGADYVKVLDFGLAKIKNVEDVFSVHSHRDLFGTPFYMAPEQIRSEQVDHRADVYALGCLAYRMLVNQHVYDAASAFDVLRQHLTAPIPSACRARPNSGIPARVDRLIFRALAKKPENRFPSAGALRDEVLGCLEDPEGASFSLPIVREPEAPEAMDSELVARLRQFDQNVSDADARMHGDPPDLPPDGAPKVVMFPMPEPPPLPGASDIILLDPASEEARFATDVRRERRLRWVALVVGPLAIAAVAWAVYALRGSANRAEAELEPNDTLKKANLLEPGVGLVGALGKRLSTFESDRDHYRLRVPKDARYLDVDLTGVADIDIAFEILDETGRVNATIDYDGIGEPESLRRFRIDTGEVFIAIRESKSGEATPTEKPDSPYTLTATAYEALPSPGETESNDDPDRASPLAIGTTGDGHMQGPRDVDIYRLEAPSDGVGRRWEIAIESGDGFVPRLAFSRFDGEQPTPIFTDEGSEGVLRTVFEEEQDARGSYLVAVSHAARGAHRGDYKLIADLREARPWLSQEPDNDRTRAGRVAIGQLMSGSLDTPGDVDVFAIPVTDPQRRTIELVVDPDVEARLQIQISDVNRLSVKDFPPIGAQPSDRPVESGIRFAGQGEVYFVQVASRDPGGIVGGYQLRARRVLTK
ncbi:MAG: serine/threonine protein kinase [Myxococcales bacterium]|nr:serine/threonine protein kinase [Myxococcales bacterium]